MSYFNWVNFFIILFPVGLFFAMRLVFLKVLFNKLVTATTAFLINVIPLSGGIFGPDGPTFTMLNGDVRLDFGFLFMFNMAAIVLSYFLTNKKQTLK